VVGAGPIGLLLLLVAKMNGAGSTTMVDIAPAPLEHARRLGADRIVDAGAPADPSASAEPGGVEVVFEASGSPAALASAIGFVRRGGTIVQVGNLPVRPTSLCPRNST
jgi:L-idonate 5-dehydrogenase